MRKIKFTEPQSETWKKWKEKCKIETQNLIDDFNSGASINIKSKLYKEQKEFYFHKDGPFHNKCAYCETQIDKFNDLDHFRPKLKVTDENDKVIKIKKNRKEEDHPGYYWLAYSCENLLPACKACNSQSNINGEPIGKKNRFPVKGKYAINPGEEIKEKPLLINPTKDNPEKHFFWDNECQLIVAKPNSIKGKMTINILGFHKREQLREDWQKTYDNIFKDFAALLSPSIPNRKQKCDEMRKKIKNGEIPYSFVALVAYEEIKRLLK